MISHEVMGVIFTVVGIFFLCYVLISCMFMFAQLAFEVYCYVRRIR